MIEMQSEGERVTPSIVYFKEDGNAVVGSVAKRNIIANNCKSGTHRKINQEAYGH